MSNYYSLRIGMLHEEDYQGFFELCQRLKRMGMLNDEAELINSGGWSTDSSIQFLILQAFLHDDPHPERYIPKA